MASCRKAVHVSTSRARTERLWRVYFRAPSQWWLENGTAKTYPRVHDFRHTLTKAPLGTESWINPSWVQDMLRLEKAEEPCEMKAREEGNSWAALSLEEALVSLEAEMLSLLPLEDVVCVLDKCRKWRNQEQALRFHAYMHESGLDAHTSLGNYLVLILVEVGSMCHAQHVFDRLVYRDEHSWSSLITGYVKCGESHHALTLYQKMKEHDSLHLSQYTFVALLKACAKLKDLERGCKLHAEIAREGLLERDVYVGSTLVDMYAKCGSLAKAQEVFDKLPVRNTVTWNALIAGYAEHGCGEEALNCYKHMQHEGVSLDVVTFVCILKACGSIGATDKGQKTHAEIACRGLDSRDHFIKNTLVDMYAKCGLLAEAQELFDKLLVRDVVSWNALIAGYVINGFGEEALHYFEQMQHEGVSPHAVTFVCSLKACGMIEAMDKGREIHAEIARKGLLERNFFVGSALVDMYAKCGSLTKAQEVFDKLLVRNIVSWNALITGYVEHEHGEEALNCFEQMQYEGISPNGVTLVCSLKACGSIGATVKGREIHIETARKGLEEELLIGSTLVDMYSRCGLLVEAHDLFDKLPTRDVVSWTALIAGYAENGCAEEALNCFQQMQHEGISPGAVTLVCGLKACGSLGAIDNVQEIHGEIARKGLLERDIFVGSTLVDMYVKCGSLANAREVFDKLPVRDVVLWTALIAGYVEHGGGEQALNCFEQMQCEGLSVDAFTFVCSLKACGIIGATVKGQEIHLEITRKGLERDLVVGSTLVDMYAKCGWLAEAHEVSDKLPVRDVVSWTALIAGYAELGESKYVLHIFDRMIGEGIKPDLVTFVSVLNACSHAGLVDKGQMYFEAISNDYGFIPNLEHYVCMVDLLGRAGHIDKAIAMIKKMPFHPSIVVWHILLGACRKWGNVELGRHAFEHAVRLDGKDAAAYVSMYNIYGDAAMQEDARRVEAMGVEKQAWKKPEHSRWMDTCGIMNSFLVADKRHSQSKNVCAKLEDLSLKMEGGVKGHF